MPRGSASEDGERPRASPRRPTKVSIGVILCRVNPASRRAEALLVHKRFSYAFADFVHGRYSRGSSRAGARPVTALLENMTTPELLDVLSLNFKQMWYRIWLLREIDELYHSKAARFQSTFMRVDGGAGLRRAVQAARARGTLLWEVPKGRRLNVRETDLACAIRELEEETGISKSEYHIIPGVKRRVSFVSDGVRYVCVYFVAMAGPRLSGFEPGSPSRPALREIHQMGEVSEIAWHDIESVRAIEREGRLEALLAPAFRLAKNYARGDWRGRDASRRPPK
jgi:8-oxo-dGTP pyrophosphatase MutT (NUDIX family)